MLACSGALVVVASVKSDPTKAAGLDVARRMALRQVHFGCALLLFAAIGFGAYGLYSFAVARYSRM